MLGSLPLKKSRFPSVTSSYPSSLSALLFCIFSLFFSYFSYESLQQSRDINKDRYQGYVVAERLQQRIENLSLIAKRYVVTGEVKYLNSYNDLIGKGDNNRTHLDYYYRLYSDLYKLDNSQIILPDSEGTSFQQLMARLNLSNTEIDLLLKVKDSAEKLSAFDSQAFSLITDKPVSANEYQKSANRQDAIKLLFSDIYLNEKANIYRFISDFLLLQGSRWANKIKAEASQELVLITLTVASFLCSIFLLTYSLRRQLNNKSIFVKALRREVSNRTLELFEKREQLKVVIHEMEETKSQLVESEKMASLGNLVSGVAHEVNTPLGISVTLGTHLQSETELLLSKIEGGKLKRSDLDRFCSESIENCTLLQSNLERAANLISSFKQVAVDQSSDEIRHFKLSEYINEVLLSLRPRLKKTSIKIEIIAPDNESLLNTYPGAVAQIITNLVMNSIIHAFNDGQEAGNIKFTLINESQYMQLRYCDNGKGMNDKVLNQIFDPFFTTRRGNGGSGLGMHIVYNLVVHQLSGEIKCESKLGEGTHFLIRLPIEFKIK